MKRYDILSELELGELELPKRFKDKIIHDVEYLLSCDISYKVEQIILFGSCARGTMRVTSDVDLLVITKQELQRSERGEIASILEEPMDAVHSDIIFYTEEQFLSSTRVITRQIKRDGICLYRREEN